MTSERQNVLDMLESGRISAQEAAQLLEALEKQSGGAVRKSAPLTVSTGDDRLAGKKLRVLVNGFTEGSKKMNVNVSVPLVLARVADNIIERCIPAAAMAQLEKEGIDIRGLRIADMVDALESLDEDIVNADIDSDDSQLAVRVYVE